MSNRKMLLVSHAPFWHDGSQIKTRSYHTMLAALPAILLGFMQYGMPAVGVVCLSVSTAIGWEWLLCRLMKRPLTISDGNAALVGLVLAMLLPATTPWWVVLTGTFIAIVIAIQIFGGIGSNPYQPVCMAIAIMALSWPAILDINSALVNYDLGFRMDEPLITGRSFGPEAAAAFSTGALLMGQHAGGIGSAFALGLLVGGAYLILRGFIRWELSVSFVAGIVVTASIFHAVDPTQYAPAAFHLLAGYTMVGAFFLVTEDATSPVNFIPMLLYGFGTGLMTVLIRNIGAYADGVVLAILLMNSINPLLDMIRPKALGKVS